MKAYLSKRIQLRQIEITRSPQMQGFYFKVTNAKGILSYIVGIHHRVPEAGKFTQKTQRIIDLCSEIITEVGLEPGTYVMNEEDERSQAAPFRYRMEHQIIKYAQSKKKPITALEDRAACEELCAKLESIALTNFLTYTADQAVYKMHHGALQRFELLESIQHGNYEELTEIIKRVYSSQEFDIVNTQRNRNWLFKNSLTKGINKCGLVSRLKDATASLAIVVGAGHLPLDCGLVNALLEQEFKVERDLS